MKVEVLSFNKMRELYDTNPDFSKAWRECRAPNISSQMGNFVEYFIQEGFLFKGI